MATNGKTTISRSVTSSPIPTSADEDYFIARVVVELPTASQREADPNSQGQLIIFSRSRQLDIGNTYKAVIGKIPLDPLCENPGVTQLREAVEQTLRNWDHRLCCVAQATKGTIFMYDASFDRNMS
ncbi:MAG: hypothetical protein HKN32_07955 [Flavobacteriales bacterium]|nr:hypothetical protein [Flavobacteriales bacterium]